MFAVGTLSCQGYTYFVLARYLPNAFAVKFPYEKIHIPLTSSCRSDLFSIKVEIRWAYFTVKRAHLRQNRSLSCLFFSGPSGCCDTVPLGLFERSPALHNEQCIHMAISRGFCLVLLALVLASFTLPTPQLSVLNSNSALQSPN